MPRSTTSSPWRQQAGRSRWPSSTRPSSQGRLRARVRVSPQRWRGSCAPSPLRPRTTPSLCPASAPTSSFATSMASGPARTPAARLWPRSIATRTGGWVASGHDLGTAASAELGCCAWCTARPAGTSSSAASSHPPSSRGNGSTRGTATWSPSLATSTSSPTKRESERPAGTSRCTGRGRWARTTSPPSARGRDRVTSSSSGRPCSTTPRGGSRSRSRARPAGRTRSPTRGSPSRSSTASHPFPSTARSAAPTGRSTSADLSTTGVVRALR